MILGMIGSVLTVVMLLCESAVALTPDLAVLEFTQKLREDGLASKAEDYLIKATRKEERNILTADVIALGLIERAELVGFPRPPAEDPVTYLVEVEMLVEDCLKGPCNTRLTFYSVPPYMDGARYHEGERVFVTMLQRGKGDTRLLGGKREHEKYVVDDAGVVARKGRPVTELAEEIRSILVARDPERLFEEADVVAIGEVMEIDQGGAAEEGHLPVGMRTHVATIRLDQVFKGSPEGSLVAVVPPVPTKTNPYFDYVLLEPGEQVLVFLHHSEDGYYEVTGGHDGKHRIGDPTTSHVLERLGDALTRDGSQGVEGGKP